MAPVQRKHVFAKTSGKADFGQKLPLPTFDTGCSMSDLGASLSADQLERSVMNTVIKSLSIRITCRPFEGCQTD